MNLDFLEAIIKSKSNDSTNLKPLKVLDFGCGKGDLVISLYNKNYDAYGFDIVNYLDSKYKVHLDKFKFNFIAHNVLPFDDESFDVVISNQVFEHVQEQYAMFKELHRIMKKNAISIHFIPAKFRLLECHTFVPFGNIFPNYYYYLFWATLGIRNKFQKNYSSVETAKDNLKYYVTSLNYISNSCYKVIWAHLNFRLEWIEINYYLNSTNSFKRLFGFLLKYIPFSRFVYRTFSHRIVLLKKI